jgi:serine/threonine protein kinase
MRIICAQNILITAAGHIKLTDFGGCRAHTEEARLMLRKSRGLLAALRDGDWREQTHSSSSSPTQTRGEQGGAIDDCRYVPPTAHDY